MNGPDIDHVSSFYYNCNEHYSRLTVRSPTPCCPVIIEDRPQKLELPLCKRIRAIVIRIGA